MKNMEGVRCISSSLIQADTHKAENNRNELTPWDLRYLLLAPIQKGLLFPKPKPSADNTFIHALKSSLSATLHHFPLMAGRLATTQLDDESDSYFIDCNNAGALFIHAEADGVTISDIIEPLHVPSIIQSFFPLNDLINHDGISEPLLGVQVTELVDGVFVGCTMNHSVVDGTSFWHFINSWSEISRGSIHLSKPPVFQRSFLDNINYPIRIPRSSVEQIREDNQFIQPQPHLVERVFHFSKETIAKLKAKANAEIGTNRISSLQALMSHLWRSITRNRKLNPEAKMICFLSFGARQRMRNVPENYFGNAVKTGMTTMEAKELLELRVGDIAREINKLIATQTEEEFEREFESWIAKPKMITMGSIATNLMGISSSPRFDVYGNDFGWGRPIAVRSGPANKSDGKLTVFCGAKERSIDVEACLMQETMEAMANDHEFMDTVTV